MRQARTSDLPARLAAVLASAEAPADPGGRFRPFLRVLAEGLSLPGAALFEAAGERFALLADHGLPAGWVEGAAALTAQDPVAAAALGHPGVAVLPGKPGWPRLPLMGHAAAAALTVGAGGIQRTVGLLVAFAEGPEAFQEPVPDLLQAAASLLAGAMASEERFREATARAERLRDLARVARRLVDLLDAEGLPQVVAEEAARLLRAEAAVFRILEGGDQLRLVAQAGGGAGSPVWRDLLRVGESLSGAVAAEGKAITIADLAGETRMLPAHREAAQAQGYRAYLGLPLHRRSQLVGVLSLYGKAVGAFTPEDVELGTGLVEQVTLALEKAELLRRERRERDRLRTLHALSRSVEGSLDLPEIFHQVVAAAAGLLGVPHAILWSPETPGGTLRQQAEHLAAGETVSPLRRSAGLALAGGAVESGEPVRLAVLAGDPRVGAGLAEDSDGQLAFAAVPLRLNERLLGAVGVFSPVPGPLDAEGMDLLTFLADHAAIAIANARLYQEARRRAERLTAMADVARTLTSSLEERAVFEQIVRAAADLLEGDMARLWVYEESRGLLRVAAGAAGVTAAPDFPLPPRDTFAPGQGLVGTVFAERAPRVVIDPEREPLYAQQAWAAAAGIRAAAAVPVRMGERALGVLSVVFRKPPHLGAEELSLLTSFANQAAVAMENARLYQDLKAYSASLEEKVRERTAALEAANVKLTEANRLKSAFLANVSHELRTPLNAVIGFSEVLEDGAFGPLNERQRLYVQNILESGQHLLGLITDILDLSKIEAGKMDLRLGRFPVAKALGEALEVVRGQAMRKAITLALEAGDDLPVLTADPGKFRQVCLNLLSNAVKFTPDGGRVAVTARAAPLDGPRGPVPGVEVAVADTGIGIEAADQERIFREFEQVDGSYARKYPGTGLGLALTRKLVEMHGGTIRVESAGTGRGATFRVRLPLRPPVLEGEILVVDDDADLLQGLTETFTRLGYGVRTARDGEEALAAVAAVPPDCLVLDLHLPRVNGLQVLRVLRERPATREIPVVALTGWGEQEGREALRLGAQEFLTKPVSPSVLAATVDRLMQRAARERGR